MFTYKIHSPEFVLLRDLNVSVKIHKSSTSEYIIETNTDIFYLTKYNGINVLCIGQYPRWVEI